MRIKRNLVIFEGPDVCGKSKAIENVYDILRSGGLKVAKFKFPNYDCIGYDQYAKCDYGKEIYKLLHGEVVLGKKRNISEDKEDFELFSRYNLLDKYHSLEYLNKLTEENDVVLLDRFMLSSYVYDTISSLKLNSDIVNKEVMGYTWNRYQNKFFLKKVKEIEKTLNKKYQFIAFGKKNFVKFKEAAWSFKEKKDIRDLDVYDKDEKFMSSIDSEFQSIFDYAKQWVPTYFVNFDKKLEEFIKYNAYPKSLDDIKAVGNLVAKDIAIKIMVNM